MREMIHLPFAAPGSSPVFGGVHVAHLLSFLCNVFFALFVFVLCPVYPMLPVTLYCPFLIPHSVFSNVYLLTIVCLLVNLSLAMFSLSTHLV
jgi:hypothetical protein